MQCYHKITLKNGNVVPCGKCPACRANERAEWIFRLKQEYKASTFAIFVTLTYDDDHVPKGFNVCKRDVQLFHKRLRKHFPSRDLRYYVVSEYGDHTFRPHYHGLYFFRHDYQKDLIYKVFADSWQQGFIKFGEVEEGSIVYCTKYCLKRSQIPEGRSNCFRLVSKMNGGLGISYLNKMRDYHVNTFNLHSVYSDGERSRMPRYYQSQIIKQFDNIDTIVNYNKHCETFINDLIDSAYEDSLNRFKEFCKLHKGLSYAEMCIAFNEAESRRHTQRDELIEKHCKKQKL